MYKKACILLTLGTLIFSYGCVQNSKKMNIRTFNDDWELIKSKDPDAILLRDSSGMAQVIVSPGFQGKVFTSTLDGPEGKSIGWVNEEAINSRDIDTHMNAYGGENRMWLGPEGSSNSIFFSEGSDYQFKNWHTPPAIDFESWKHDSVNQKQAWMSHVTEIRNMRGMQFNVEIRRKVSLLSLSDAAQILGKEIGAGIKMVAFSTDNKIINKGDQSWTKETGTISIWMLDMFSPSERATIVVPYQADAPSSSITTDYFGAISEDRLVVSDGYIYLLADGKSRGKIGVSGACSRSWAASYDPVNQLFTYIKFDVDPEAAYLNQEWTDEKDPFSGDAVNAYNDGPLEDGSQLGPFYELESSSPGAFLHPGEAMEHRHSVFHFSGNRNDLDSLIRRLTGIRPDHLETVFSR